jgi:hypothetical protein
MVHSQVRLVADTTNLAFGCYEFPTDEPSGTILGVYATSNGGAGTTESYITRWRYQGKGQEISDGSFVPYSPFV